jgi:hypothetical protein
MALLSRIDAWLKVDMVFFRVCFFLLGALLLLLLSWGIVRSPPQEWWAWLLVALFLACGGALIALSTLASDSRVDRAVDFLGDGGDVFVVAFLLLLGLLAIPLTLLIRSVRPASP